MNNLPKNYPIYETPYGSDIPVEQTLVHVFDYLPSKRSTIKKYSSKIYEYFIEKGFEQECEIVSESRRQIRQHNEIFLLHRTTKKGVLLKSTNDKSDDVFELVFFYDSKYLSFHKQFDQEEISKYEVVLKKSGINLVKSEMGHLDIEEYDLNVPDIDLELNYGKDFIKVHDLIVKRLNKLNDKGIILFHGDPGTGKTSYLKYLTRLIEHKEILFIPPSMAESIAEPSIIPFLMEHKNSILIIEDAERVIADREVGNGSSIAVSNLLNLTDGILGDCLNIQIVATFNMKREKIDQALLRKGRLIAEHKFNKLNVEDTNTLLKHIGKDINVNEPMVLADIYNIDEEFYKADKGDKKIGF